MTPSAPTDEPKRLSNAQLSEVLALIKKADSVELKLTVPHTEGRSVFFSNELRGT
jgi:hypothetical protein